MERAKKAESIQKSTTEEICTLEKDCGGKCKTCKKVCVFQFFSGIHGNLASFLTEYMATECTNINCISYNHLSGKAPL